MTKPLLEADLRIAQSRLLAERNKKAILVEALNKIVTITSCPATLMVAKKALGEVRVGHSGGQLRGAKDSGAK